MKMADGEFSKEAANRRRFLFDTARIACGVGMLCLGLGLYAKRSKALLVLTRMFALASNRRPQPRPADDNRCRRLVARPSGHQGQRASLARSLREESRLLRSTLPGRWSPVRVSTPQCSERNDCMDSMDCIDVCSKDVFAFGPRFNNPPSTDPLGRPAD